MSQKIYQFGASRAEVTGYQVQTGAGVLHRIDGYCNGANSFLQVFDLAAAPAANAIPLKSIRVYGNDAFAITFLEVDEVEFSNGIYIALSTDETKYTADASGTKISGDATVEDLSGLIGTTKVGPTALDSVSGVFDIWDMSAGSKTLKRLKIANTSGAASKYFAIVCAASASDNNSVPVLIVPMFSMDTGTAVNTSPDLNLDLVLYGKDGSTLCTGCTVFCTSLANPARQTVADLVAAGIADLALVTMTAWYK